MILPHLYSEVLPVFLFFFFFLPKQKPLNWRDAAVLTTPKNMLRQIILDIADQETLADILES